MSHCHVVWVWLCYWLLLLQNVGDKGRGEILAVTKISSVRSKFCIAYGTKYKLSHGFFIQVGIPSLMHAV